MRGCIPLSEGGGAPKGRSRSAGLRAGLFALLVGLVFTAMVSAAFAATPTISSDLADYPPGGEVHLSGTDWQGDTTVRIAVNDDFGASWSYASEVPVEADGTIADRLRLPDWFVATYRVTAVGAQTGRVAVMTFADAAGAYTVKWYAADPAVNRGPYLPTYDKKLPIHVPQVWGSAADPMPRAVAYASPKQASNLDAVTSLAPKDLVLGQVVPFEVEIIVNGSTAPENGTINFTAGFSTHTSSGHDFGYDPAYMIYGAFVDTADPGTVDAGTPAAATLASQTLANAGTSNEEIQGKINVTGLQSGDAVIVEVWVVLKSTIPLDSTGNVATRIVGAATAPSAGLPNGDSISTGNQTVPLLRVREFFTSDADLSITKVDTPDPVAGGTTLSYTVAVTNNSPNVYANSVVVTDTLDPNVTLVPGSVLVGGVPPLVPYSFDANGDLRIQIGALAPGATTVVTFDVVVANVNPRSATGPTSAPGSASQYDRVNRVTVSALTDDPDPTNNTAYAYTNVFNPVPAPPVIMVTKTPDPGTVPETGGLVTYTVVISNLSPQAVTVTDVTDDVFGNLNIEAGLPLPPLSPVGQAGDSATFTFTGSVSGEAGTSHINNVWVTAVDDFGQPADATDDATVTFTDIPPEIVVTKTANPTSVPETGGDVEFTITVDNTGTEPVTLTGAIDTVFGPIDVALFDIQDIPVGGTATYSFTEFMQGEPDAPHNDVVTVDAEDNDGTPVSDSDDADVTYEDVAPEITVTKTADPTSVPETGGDVTFTIVVENTGTEPVTLIDTIDTVFGPIDVALFDKTYLVVGDTATYSFVEFMQGEPASPHNDVATVTAEDNEGTDATDSDDADVAYEDVAPLISVTKTANPTSLPETGGDVEFTVLVENIGTEPVTLTGGIDTVFGVIPAASFDKTYLVVGDSAVYTFTEFLASDMLLAHNNVVTVTAVDNEDTPVSDSDDADVDFFDIAPEIVVTKTANPTSVPETGGDVEFTITVENIGTEPVTLTGAIDTVFGPIDVALFDIQDIPVGGTATYSFTEFMQGEPDAPHNDVVTVDAEDNDGTPVSDSDDADVTYEDVAPEITVTKTADPTSVPETGGDVTFTIVVENTGTEPVTLIDTIDTVFGPIDVALFDKTYLVVGDTATYSFVEFMQGEPASPHNDVATVTAEDNEGTDATDSDDADVAYEDVAPLISVTKTANPTSLPETGGDVEFTVLVENIGTEPVTLTGGIDTVFGVIPAASFDKTYLVVGDSAVYTFTEFLASDMLLAHNNVVTVTAVDNEDTPVSDSDDADVDFFDIAPEIVVTKTANPTSVPETGGDVEFTITVDNTGTEPVTLTGAIDTVFGPIDVALFDIQDIPVGGTATYSFTEFMQGEPDAPHSDVVTVDAEDNDGTPVSDSDDADVTYQDVAPEITVTKTADPTSVPETGGDVTFTILIENTGPEDVTLTDLVDDVFGDLNGKGTISLPQFIPVGGSYSGTFTEWLDSDMLIAHENEVLGTAYDDDGTMATDDDDALVIFSDVPPLIEVTKSASPTHVPETGGDVTFTITVENIGTEAVTLIDSVDTVFGPIDVALFDIQVIPVGGTATYSFTEFMQGEPAAPHNDVVTVTAEDNEGTDATDSDDADVDFDDLLPDVTLAKTVDDDSKPEPGGVFNFTLTITNDGPEAFTIESLTDDNLSAPYPAAVDDLIGQTIPAGGHLSATYPITHTDVGTYPNSAEVTVADNDGNPDSDTAEESVEVTDILPTIEVAKSATPDRIQMPGGLVTYTYTITNTSSEPVDVTAIMDDKLGDLLADAQSQGLPTPLAVGESFSFTVQTNIDDPMGGSITNTVDVTAVDDEGNPATDSASATVRLFWYGFTPGYWKNHSREWSRTDYEPKTLVVDVFDIPESLLTTVQGGIKGLDLNRDRKNDTLMNALAYQGGANLAGKAQILLRAATAAVLNESALGDAFPPYDDVNGIVMDVNEALATGDPAQVVALGAILDYWNNIGIHQWP